MTTHRLTRALSTLQEAVVRSRAVDVLGRLRPYSTASRPDVQAVLQVFADLTVGQARFGPSERALLAALQLQVVLDTGWWARLVTALSRSTIPEELATNLVNLCARLEMVATGFPALAALLDAPEPVEAPPLIRPGALILTVAGKNGLTPSLTQTGQALDAVNQLWAGCETLTGYSGTLHLVAVQPGPATTLHFDGEAEPLAELHGLLMSILEQVDLLPNLSAEQHAISVPPMLDLLDRIGRSGRADAMRVRNAIETGVRNLLQAGCSLSDPDEPVTGMPPHPLASHDRTGDDDLDLDAGHLARVIADERRQLVPVVSEPARPPRQPSAGAARAP